MPLSHGLAKTNEWSRSHPQIADFVGHSFTHWLANPPIGLFHPEVSKDLEHWLFQAANELGISCVTICHRPALLEHHHQMLLGHKV